MSELEPTRAYSNPTATDVLRRMLDERDEYYKTAEGENVAPDTEQNIAEVIVAKNRHGSTETVKVGWTGRYTKFREIANEENLPR